MANYGKDTLFVKESMTSAAKKTNEEVAKVANGENPSLAGVKPSMNYIEFAKFWKER